MIVYTCMQVSLYRYGFWTSAARTSQQRVQRSVCLSACTRQVSMCSRRNRRMTPVSRWNICKRYPFISFQFCLYGKVKLFKRLVHFICLFNDCVETKWSCGLHMWLGAMYKRVALERIRCFAFHKRQEMYSRYKRQRILHFARIRSRSKVKAVWLCETTNGLQSADYLPHVTRGGLDS